MKSDWLKTVLTVVLSSLTVASASAADGVLKLTFSGQIRSIKASELLARKDVKNITIPNDVAYGRSMTYRAVPLLALMGKSAKLDFDLDLTRPDFWP